MESDPGPPPLERVRKAIAMGMYTLGDVEAVLGLELGGGVLRCEFCDAALGIEGAMRDGRVPDATLCASEHCMEERAGLTDEELANVIAAHRGE